MMHRLYHLLCFLWEYARKRLAAAGRGPHIFLMSTPQHGNLGDEAIILAEYQLLREIFPAWRVIEYPTAMLQKLMRWPFLCPAMQGDDFIALPGGGNLGSLYPMEEAVHRFVVQKYPAQRKIFFPQSVFFGQDERGRQELAQSQAVYGADRHLTILERDVVSHAYARQAFPQNTHLLAPDAVTALDCRDILAEKVRRQGVVFFLRGDKEKVLSDALVRELCDWLREKKIPNVRSDTVIDATLGDNAARRQAVWEKLRLAHGARLVITDRYHGTIFSVITHTPVIAFRSYDTKISAGIRWFASLPWVHYAEGMEAAAMEEIMASYCGAQEVEVRPYSDCGEKIRVTLREWAEEEKHE